MSPTPTGFDPIVPIELITGIAGLVVILILWIAVRNRQPPY